MTTNKQLKEMTQAQANKSYLTQVSSKWLGIRIEKIGRAAKVLHRAPGWRCNAADLNNIYAVNFQMHSGDRSLASYAEFFKHLADAGLVGVAFQWTELQRKHNAPLTPQQWQERVAIGS